MPYRCLVFDADNTLYRTKTIAKQADMAGMGVLARGTKKAPKALYSEFLGIVEKVKSTKDPEKRSRLHSYKILAKRYKLPNAEMAYTIFFRAVRKHIRHVPGVAEFLEKAGKYYTIGIVTEDDRILAIRKLQKLGLDRFAKILITSTDTNIMKPSMRYYTLLQKKARCRLKECIIIGDSYEKDLALPQKKGAFVIAFGRPHRLANYSVRNYKELARFLSLR